MRDRSYAPRGEGHDPSVAATRDIRLLDAGDGRRLEQFGQRVVDRPHPAAIGPRSAVREWRTADLRFDKGGGWIARDVAALGTGGASIAPWTVEIDGLALELRTTPSGGVGLFPEQLVNAVWLREQLQGRRGADPERDDAHPEAPAVLNLFAHTGLLTLGAARAGASVTHVDGSRPTVGWARRNAELSDLAGARIRWIVDDAVAFTRREARRGRRYDGIVLDPPSYGHAGRRAFELESALDDLLEACAAVATAAAFVLLTAHSTRIGPDRLLDAMSAAFGRPPRAFEIEPLALVAETGAVLELGFAIRGGR
jgi:23S rRNA (cytosine1962-C5)-methyltransferase